MRKFLRIPQLPARAMCPVCCGLLGTGLAVRVLTLRAAAPAHLLQPAGDWVKTMNHPYRPGKNLQPVTSVLLLLLLTGGLSAQTFDAPSATLTQAALIEETQNQTTQTPFTKNHSTRYETLGAGFQQEDILD